MENVEAKPRKRVSKIERVPIEGDTLNRINHWIDQIQKNGQGVKISRKAIVEWLVGNHPPELSMAEVKILQEKNFDEVNFTAWALSEMRLARSQGKELKLSIPKAYLVTDPDGE